MPNGKARGLPAQVGGENSQLYHCHLWPRNVYFVFWNSKQPVFNRCLAKQSFPICKNLVQHLIETTIKNWLFGVPDWTYGYLWHMMQPIIVPAAPSVLHPEIWSFFELDPGSPSRPLRKYRFSPSGLFF